MPGYANDIGTAYTVWTHDAFSAYRRHIFLDKLTSNITVTFEIPSLDAAAWFPLRIRICDAEGLFFQTDQKLVVERIGPAAAQLTSWKKIPQLRTIARFRQNLNHLTLPEIKDFNALSDL